MWRLNYILFYVCNIPNGTALTIEEAILSCLDEKGLNLSHLSWFGSDGNSGTVKWSGHISQKEISQVGYHSLCKPYIGYIVLS